MMLIKHSSEVKNLHPYKYQTLQDKAWAIVFKMSLV